jgi:outer membrane protein
MKRIFITAIFLVLVVTMFSQSGITTLQYSIGFGTGDMHDYIGNVSFRGFTFDYRKLVQPNIGVGVDIGWNVFYEEKPWDVYEGQNNITYSGKQWRYSNHFPMLVGVDYYVNPGAEMSVYGGLGLGTMYSLQNTDMGAYTFEKDAWHFVLRPEIGVLIQPAPGVGFTILSKYYYGFKAGDLPAQGFVTINIGFVFVQ